MSLNSSHSDGKESFPNLPLLRDALRGSFRSILPASSVLKPSFSIEVFVSSTFTDTQRERDFLVQELLPLISEKARPFDVNVSFVDLRWGIRDENTKDHLTWTACAEELDRCRRNSMGLSFLSLQSHKYGYRPLPKHIPKLAFENKLSVLSAQLQTLAREWYILDLNELDGGHYVLRNLITSEDSERFWNRDFKNLLEALDGVIFESHGGCDFVVGNSVTSYEVSAAFSCGANKGGLVWLHRSFPTGVSLDFDRAEEYDDILVSSANPDNVALKNKFDDMIGWMNATFDPNLIKRYEGVTYESYRSNDAQWKAQFELFKADSTELLLGSLEKLLSVRHQWDIDGCGINLPGSVLSEILHHYDWAKMKCRSFQRREGLLDECIEIIESSGRADADDATFCGISLALVGASGSGKTAMMAKLAQLMSERSTLPIIIRFCGTSSGSKTGFQLVLNVCHQIHHLMDRPFNYNSVSSLSYDDLVRYFQGLLSEFPVILFIDSLDQLSDENQARSRISFLKKQIPEEESSFEDGDIEDEEEIEDGVEGEEVGEDESDSTATNDSQPYETGKCIIRHPDVRIIVSALLDDDDMNNVLDVSQQPSYFYGCETRLKQAGECIPIVEVKLDDHHSTEMLRSLLLTKHRKLTPDQWIIVQSSVNKEPSVLYLQLALRVVQNWSSTLPMDQAVLAGGVRNLVNQIFDSIERSFGSLLVRAAFSFITFSVQGVTDNEMIDLLSLDDEVMAAVNQYNIALRLPSHVWYRLRAALVDLLVVQQDNCMTWYHRQLRETSAIRYQATNKRYHELMGRYFGDLVDPKIVVVRQIRRQPLVLSPTVVWAEGAVINRRRCTEAGQHMIDAGLVLEAVSELCTLEGICARARCKVIFSTIFDMFNLSKLAKDQDSGVRDRIDHFFRWISKDGNRIDKAPVYGTLCTASEQPKISRVSQALTDVNSSFQKSSLADASVWSVLSYGGKDQFDSLLMNLEGHVAPVSSVSISRDNSIAVSGSWDNTAIVWNIATGKLLHRIEEHDEAVEAVVISADASAVFTCSEDKTIKMFDTRTGLHIRTFKGHRAGVKCMVVSYDGSILLSGSKDESIKLWEVSSGKLIKSLKGHKGPVNTIAAAPDYSFFISGSDDHLLKIWSTAHNSLRATLTGHTVAVTSIAISQSGKILASADKSGLIKIWSTITGKVKISIKTSTKKEKLSIDAVVITSDAKLVLSASDDNAIRVFEVATGLLMAVQLGHTSCVQALTISFDNTIIMSGSVDMTAKLWEMPTTSPTNTHEGHTECVMSVKISDRGLAASASEDGTVKIWDLAVGSVKCSFSLGDSKMSPSLVKMSLNGSVVAGVVDAFTVVLWNTSTGDPCATLLLDKNEDSGITSIDLSMDGFLIAVGTKKGTIVVWSAEDTQVTHYQIESFEGHSDLIHAISVCGSNKSTIVSSSVDKQIILWDVAQGAKIKVINVETECDHIVVSFDGSTIVGIAGDYIHVWNANSGQLQCSMEENDSVALVVAVSGDGSLVVSGGSWQNELKLWDGRSGQLKHKISGHSSFVTAIDLSLNGSTILAGAFDNSIKLWSAVMPM